MFRETFLLEESKPILIGKVFVLQLNTTDTDIVYFARILFVLMAGSRIKEIGVILSCMRAAVCRSRVHLPFCRVSPLRVELTLFWFCDIGYLLSVTFADFADSI